MHFVRQIFRKTWFLKLIFLFNQNAPFLDLFPIKLKLKSKLKTFLIPSITRFNNYKLYTMCANYKLLIGLCTGWS